MPCSVSGFRNMLGNIGTFAAIRADKRFAGTRFEFIGYDPYVYHCMIRNFKPARIIEVGAGYSTLVAMNAANLNGAATEITAIEPYPGDLLQSLSRQVHIVRQTAQSVELDVYTDLRENDILFIDSSHVVKTGSDVCFLVLEALPRLHQGVIVHFHDIFLPLNYPLTWLVDRRVFWNEQYLLQAYLMHNQRARVLFAVRFMMERHADLMSGAFFNCQATGGSLWLRV